MPAYLTHAIMGEEVYKWGTEAKLFKAPVILKDMRTFSLGTDLASLSKVSAYDSHNRDTRSFFIHMIDYIKKNKLMEDEKVMALLYGHIAHYFLDVNVHPYIYYLERKLKRTNNMLSNHVLIEGYLSSYFCEKILGKDYMSVKPVYFNQGAICYRKNAELIRYVYDKVYKDVDIMFSYYSFIRLFTYVENAIKHGLFSKDFVIKFFGFDEFLAKNDIESIYLTNPNNNRWLHPITGEPHFDNIDMLYLKSIIDTLEAIEEVNKYIYGIYNNISSLEHVFSNLSYDTGVECSLAYNFVHVLKN